MSYLDRRIFLSKQTNPPHPRLLYKYAPFIRSRVEQVLLESVLWLSGPTDFNDPFDMTADLQFDGSPVQKRERINLVLKKHGMRFKERRRLIEGLMASPLQTRSSLFSGIKGALEAPGVYSMTAKPKDLLMWSHYADRHTGIVYQFDPAIDVWTIARALPITYSTIYPVFDWLDTENTSKSVASVILTKHQGWEYEDEWRIIHPEGAKTHLRFDPAALTGVIIGCKASDETEYTVRDLLKKRMQLGFPQVKLFRAHMHTKAYKLVVSCLGRASSD